MIWNVEYTNEFGEWYRGLSETQQDDITAGTLLLLMELGPQLPISLRAFYALDPRRSAIPLIGGDKTGDNHFEERMVPVADDLYDTYIEEIRKESLIP